MAQQVASVYLELYPDVAAELQREAHTGGEQFTAEQLLWRHWTVAKRMWQEPLYPYLIALTYCLLQPDPRWVLLWQMALGVVGLRSRST